MDRRRYRKDELKRIRQS
ncbi:hypothetical protein Goklo_026622, partial [Gossypium klotzschianum]|nr:hypothetical protein [Gossypium klotzschianum]